MDYKVESAGDVRSGWAAAQSDTIAGTAIIVKRHDLTTAVMMPPEWEGVFSSSTWQRALPLLRQKFPDKSDYWLLTDTLQKFLWDQDNNNSKGAKLDRIYHLLLWVARKLGYEEAANA